MTKEEKTAYDKKYREEHREEKAAKGKIYYENNSEKLLNKQKIYYKNNSEVIDERNKIYYKNNIEEITEYKKKYREEHTEYYREYMRDYCRKRRNNDPSYKIICNLRRRLNHLIKGKHKHTIELIGCSVDELKTHLESKFQEGMSFENYGSWHIDHIRPCSSFNLINEEEQKECFNYTNLQPLWAVDNLRKGSKWNYEL